MGEIDFEKKKKNERNREANTDIWSQDSYLKHRFVSFASFGVHLLLDFEGLKTIRTINDFVYLMRLYIKRVSLDLLVVLGV